MIRFGDYLWRSRRAFNSVGDWAVARGCPSALKPLPALQPSSPAGVEIEPGRWHLAELPQGKVVGDLRLAVTAEDEVLGQLQALHGIADPAAHWVTRQLRLRRPWRLRGAVVTLAAAAGANYYHWLFDSVPRFHLLRLSGMDLESVDFFLINESDRTFDLDSLQMLGIPAERTFRCSKRQIIVAERLFVPPMPTPLPGQIAPWVCEFLRASFLSKARPTARGARLYLSRRSSPKRPLANEAQVELFFREHGFKSIQLETLSFREQVETFAGVAFVAGPHGAGFANLVFAPPNTRIIELFHPKHQIKLYENLATGLGMRYQSVIGVAPNENRPAGSEKLGPYTVELDQIKKLLDH